MMDYSNKSPLYEWVRVTQHLVNVCIHLMLLTQTEAINVHAITMNIAS